MSSILDALLGGRTIDESLTQGAKRIKIIGGQSNVREFRVTKDNGFTTTELYPNSKSLSNTILVSSKC